MLSRPPAASATGSAPPPPPRGPRERSTAAIRASSTRSVRPSLQSSSRSPIRHVEPRDVQAGALGVTVDASGAPRCATGAWRGPRSDEPPGLDEVLDVGVVGGDLAELPAAQQVGAGVADVAEHHAAAVGHQDGERRRHAEPVEVALDPEPDVVAGGRERLGDDVSAGRLRAAAGRSPRRRTPRWPTRPRRRPRRRRRRRPGRRRAPRSRSPRWTSRTRPTSLTPAPENRSMQCHLLGPETGRDREV